MTATLHTFPSPLRRQLVASVEATAPKIARRFWCAGGAICASDGSRIDYADAPLLAQAWARETLKLLNWGALETARRFGLEAESLDAAYQEAKRWRAASGPVRESAQ